MTVQRRPGKYPEAVRSQAVRLVLDHRDQYEPEWAATDSRLISGVERRNKDPPGHSSTKWTGASTLTRSAPPSAST
jgi:hypothetical protein